MKTIFFLPLLFLGCAALQPVTNQPEPNTPVEKTETVKINPVIRSVEASLFDKTFDIALILPFYTDDITYDSVHLQLNEIPSRSSLAIHYYEGVLMALDSLDKMEIKINLHVYDSKTDSNDVKKILAAPEMNSMDAFIGPVNNSSLSVVARYCKENKKLLFSPLSSSSPVTDNPYFVLANSTLKTHCETMMEYIQTKLKPKKIILLYHHDGLEDTYTGYFKNYLAPGDSSIHWVELTQDVDSSYFKLEENLSAIDNNIVVIPSFDEAFVNTMTKQMASLSDNYKFTVFGMPTWTEMESLRNDYLQQINTYITGSFWLNHSSTSLNSFREKYFEKFKSKPLDFTYQGYDLMFYIGSLIQKGGKNWQEDMEKTKLNEPGVRFEIAPVYSTDAEKKKDIQFFENKYVHLLKYSGNTLIKVN